MRSTCRRSQMLKGTLLSWVFWTWALLAWPGCVRGMRESRIRKLREETEYMFFHGFDNYMQYAFPEDELRPLTCAPLTRDRANPAHIELNDVLGNYSLTLVDSLSTLAIMADAKSRTLNGARAWSEFQNGVGHLVELYGDGSDDDVRGTGSRGKGFELDSKVQVFETVIRGLGGLLSAHLFAVGDLPIRGYEPPHNEAEFARAWDKSGYPDDQSGIRWDGGFIYDGQLLRLAMDLGTRLLPAFYTPTGLPYPRVNLRDGVPFYANSPLNAREQDEDSDDDDERAAKPASEITETCSAGAGSLVLELTVLSRLTGDGRFEELAKRAFWAVWMRRTDIGLIGAGIDAESGKWVSSYTGIGAGIDSFFEYAVKSYILLSEGEPVPPNSSKVFDPLGEYYLPLTADQHSPDSFLKTWQDAQVAIKRHLYRGSGYQHPHYIQGDILTGATRAFWIDSLSAYFPGLLTLAGDLEDAIESHLLNTAVWTRFSALPERWNVASGDIDSGLGWWGGRPEFVESNYYLYRATKDPWLLYVGEMALRDIKRRCWTKCGWAGLHDVRTGELSDRMESFFLGETAKYLYLLFEPSHPLNHLDAPFVFTTEGHPLVIPKSVARKHGGGGQRRTKPEFHESRLSVCPAPDPPLPFGLSAMAGRPDVFHAATLARLHLRPKPERTEGAIVEYNADHPSLTLSDLSSPSNYTYFPWTLPVELVPSDATSSPMAVRPTLDLSFPPMPNTVISPGSLERVESGVLVKSISGLRLGMIQDIPLLTDSPSAVTEGYRIQVINNVPLGKDEKVFISRETTNVLDPEDPNFTRIQDPIMLDIVIDVDLRTLYQNRSSSAVEPAGHEDDNEHDGTVVANEPVFDALRPDSSGVKMTLSSLMNHVTSLLRDDSFFSAGRSFSHQPLARITIPAITPTGRGAVPVLEAEEAASSSDRLSWSTIFLADEACDGRFPISVPRTHQIIVMKRGRCSFSQKLRSIPSFRPSRSSLQLVIVVSYPQPETAESAAPNPGSAAGSSDSTGSSSTPTPGHAKPLSFASPPFTSSPDGPFDESWLIRPLLEELQVVGEGIPRPKPISMVMVGGGDETYDYFRHAHGIGIRRRHEIRSQGVPISNLIIT